MSIENGMFWVDSTGTETWTDFFPDYSGYYAWFNKPLNPQHSVGTRWLVEGFNFMDEPRSVYLALFDGDTEVARSNSLYLGEEAGFLAGVDYDLNLSISTVSDIFPSNSAQLDLCIMLERPSFLDAWVKMPLPIGVGVRASAETITMYFTYYYGGTSANFEYIYRTERYLSEEIYINAFVKHAAFEVKQADGTWIERKAQVKQGGTWTDTVPQAKLTGVWE